MAYQKLNRYYGFAQRAISLEFRHSHGSHFHLDPSGEDTSRPSLLVKKEEGGQATGFFTVSVHHDLNQGTGIAYHVVGNKPGAPVPDEKIVVPGGRFDLLPSTIRHLSRQLEKI